MPAVAGGEVAGAAEQVIVTMAADGWPLGMVRVPAIGTVRGVALLLHAMLADRRSMARTLAPALAAQGLEVLVADFRGRGHSAAPSWRRGRWSYDDLVLRDVPALVGAARKEFDLPLAVVGHSLGGHVAAAALGCGAVQVDALVGLAANIWHPELEPDPLVRLAKDTSIRIFAAASRPLGRFPTRALRVGSVDEASDYVQDLARFWRSRQWTSRDGRHDWDALLARVDVPVLAVLGLGDALFARMAGAAAWTCRFPHPSLWVAGAGAHGVAGRPGHMDLVTDAACRPLHEAVGRWLAETLGSTRGAR